MQTHLGKLYSFYYYLVVLCLGFVTCGYSQITISTPNVGFTQACASATFNTYNFSFSFFPPQNLLPGNQFIVELSNATGSFASPTTIKVLTNTTSPVSSNFVLPSNVYGDGYRIRVRSTAPVKVSPSSLVFPAYYAIHNTPFSINNNVGTVHLCIGDSYTLSIDDTGTPASPLFYPELNYIWYKDYVEIPGETGPTLTVSQQGSYYVVTDYGPCVMNSYSNMIQVQIQPTLNPVVQASGGITTICPTASVVLTCDIQDNLYTYTWYRDGGPISGSDDWQYSAAEEGVYYVKISAPGGCEFDSNAITLNVTDFDLEMDTSTETVLIPGETIPLTAITDAVSPIIEWYKDNVLIAGATALTYSVTQPGEYKVVITEPGPCNVTKEAVLEVVNPLGFILQVQSSAGYQNCVTNATTLDIQQFDALTSSGAIDLIGNSLGYTYQWYKNGTPIAGATTTTYTVTDASQNGNYFLRVTIPGYSTVDSNTQVVNLAAPLVTISGDTVLCALGTIPLTSSVTNSGYTYQWYKDSIAIPGETFSGYTVTAAGVYYLTVTGGACVSQSNLLTVQNAAITVDSTTPAVDLILPGQTKVLSVTTTANGPQYSWTRDGAPIGGNSGSLSATQDGEYKVVVTQTVGCSVTEERTFILEYPTGFTITVAPDAGYTACAGSTATLSIADFTAQTPSGDVPMTNLGYSYQWYLEGVPVPGGIAQTHAVNSASQNGEYSLGITMPDFATILSNDVIINLSMPAVTISGITTLCTSGTVLLSSGITDPVYTYQWYKDSFAIAGATSTTYTANSIGDYYIVVTGGVCSSQSNILQVVGASITVNSSNPAIDIILPGQTKTLTVTTDANVPSYSWTKDGQPIAGTTATATVTQAGDYVVAVTQTAGCNVTENHTFILDYPSGFSITVAPNAGYSACTSSSATLSITNFTAQTPSGTVVMTDLGYSYQWYLDGVPVPGATSQTLSIANASQNGEYSLGITMPDFAMILSNDVIVNLTIPAVTISSSSVLCEGGTVVLSSNVSGGTYAYQWYKDNIAIPGATASTYTADAAGNYQLTLTGGSCLAQSNVLSLTVSGITVTSTSPNPDIILPGQTKTLTVSTNAGGAQYSWTKDGAPISGTTATATAAQDGEYTVEVTQTVGCNVTEEYTFVLDYPTGFTITVSPNAAYTACTSSNATLHITSFIAQTPSGPVPMTDLGYSYQWYLNGTPVPGATGQTLSLGAGAQNGDYSVSVTMPDFAAVFSNAVTINLGMPAVTISSNSVLCEGGTVMLSSNITGAGYTYQWYKDNAAIAGATSSTYVADAEGDYQLNVTSGACTVQSNVISLTVTGITVSTTSLTPDIILPGQTKTLTVTTNAVSPAFEWRRNGILLPETSATLNTTQDGTYTVEVTQTSGCNATATQTFVLGYPTGFTITVVADGGYIPCTSTTVTLDITSFIAQTANGPVPMTDLGYSYQWFLNNSPVPGATSTSLTLNDISQSGDYKLQVIMPGFSALMSNVVAVNLGVASVAIAADGVLCDNNPDVLLTADLVNPAYNYTWFKDNVQVDFGNNPTYLATDVGDYYVTINTGPCVFSSNILAVEESDFDLSPDGPLTGVIVQGDTKILTVITDALSPTFQWYRNSVEIPGANTDTLYATQDGDYTIVVTQTQDCIIEKELVFKLVYPLSFTVNVVTSSDFVQCEDLSGILEISMFNANTSSGPIDILGNSFGYQYQWYLDNTPIAGATGTTFNVAQSGSYSLGVTIPFAGETISNIVTVTVGFVADVLIETEDVFCSEGTTIDITSNVNDPQYTYNWYKEGSAQSIGSNTSLNVTETGTYFLEVTYQNCTVTSNLLEIIPYDMEQVTISSGPMLDLPEGTTVTVTASGAEVYEWFQNGISVSIGSTYVISQPGTYSVEATIGECTVSKEIIVTLVENNIIAIPNLITPNNDGINDKWVLPLKYLNREDIEIVIYGPDGTMVFKSVNYGNTWPESDFTYSKKNPVYYYTIMEGLEIVKRGSITIVE